MIFFFIVSKKCIFLYATCFLFDYKPKKSTFVMPYIADVNYKYMQIELIVIGKTDSKEIQTIVEEYAKRVNHYCKFAITTLPDLKGNKNMSPKQQRMAEGEVILKQLSEQDYVVLLDERGSQYRSMEFAQWLQKRMNSGVKRLVLIVGGAFGFSDDLYERAHAKVSLSSMTFSHQIIRAIFAEQIYRAFTILNNEPYHNE